MLSSNHQDKKNKAFTDGAIVSFPPFCALPHMRQLVLFYREPHISQLQETISRNPTVSYENGAVIGREETRLGFFGIADLHE